MNEKSAPSILESPTLRWLRSLPSLERQAVELVEGWGDGFRYPLAVAARVLGVSEGEVRQLVAVARAKRDRCKDWCKALRD